MPVIQVMRETKVGRSLFKVGLGKEYKILSKK
jgi:hypothetical protein